MKGVIFRKSIAIICAITLVISPITYLTSSKVNAQSYDSLTYTTLGSDISFSYLNNEIAANNPELLDSGVTLQIAYSSDNREADTVITINGVTTPNGSGAVTHIGNGLVKLNPTLMDNNAYTLIVVTTTKGKLELVVKKGTPVAGGEIPTSNKPDSSQGAEHGTTVTPPNPDVEPATTTTATGPQASKLPVKVVGVVAQTEVGEYTIDNSVMVAWASSTDVDNVAGYDSTVTSYNVYIYKNGKVITHIVNATNGGVIGGLSQGRYQAAVAAVNSKGEGTISDKINFDVTGSVLNYTYPPECNGPKTPSGLAIITANPEVQPSVGNETNAIEVAWAASSNPQASSYDASVAGYNIYLFDVATGNPYRRVYVDGISETYTAIKSVSAGTYLVYLSAVDAQGKESALSAPGISLPSTVTVTGNVIDNAQDFDYPDQPTLPLGLEIITQGIQYGFTVAWSAEADLTGIKLNLYVDGVCIKSGINTGESSYYENRVSAGTYTIEVKAQYVSNNVESFPLTKIGVTIASDPGLEVKTPGQLADPNYIGYKEPETTTPTPVEPTNPTEPTSKPGVDNTTSTAEPDDITTNNNKPIETLPPVLETTVTPTEITTDTPSTEKEISKSKVKKANKKFASNKAKLSIKRVKNANGYQVQFSQTKKFKKVLVEKNVKKINNSVKSKKIVNKKKLFVRVRAYRLNGRKKVFGDWSKAKKVKIK